MQTDSLTMHGLVSKKINPTDDSWVNSLLNVLVRLPDTSDGRSIDVDWSDSAVENCHFTDGIGGRDGGYGVNPTANNYKVGPIANNVELTSGVPAYVQSGSWTVPALGVININS